jgi:WD40 repeat protein
VWRSAPDGELLATADADGTVRLWNPATGQPTRTPMQAYIGYAVNGVAFSPDGELLATAYSDGYVSLWNPATGHAGGTLLADPGRGGRVNGVAFSPDGELLAAADEHGTVPVWSLATRRHVPHGCRPRKAGQARSPRAGHFLAAHDHSQGRSLQSRRQGDWSKRQPLSSDRARQSLAALRRTGRTRLGQLVDA